MHNDESQNWMNAVSIELQELLNTKKLSPTELAAMLNIVPRDLQRVAIGINSAEPRIVGSEVYAKLFHHCGLMSSDPRRIPSFYNGDQRAWNQREYIHWVTQQGQPLLSTNSNAAIDLLRELIDMCESLMTTDLNQLEELATHYTHDWKKLQKLVRFMLLSPEDRKYEIEVNSNLHIQGGNS